MSHPQGTSALPRTDRRQTGAMALILLLGGGVILWFGRHWDLFFWDEWTTAFYRREGWIGAFFAPHGGHLIAVLLIPYRILFATVGLDSYWPYKIVGLAVHLGVVWLLFTYARARLQPAVAVMAVIPLLFLGSAWEVLFWPYIMGFDLPLLCFLAALLLSRAVWIALFTGIALATSGVGLAVASGLLVEMSLRRDARRVAAVLAPICLYGLWYIFLRPTLLPPSSLLAVPGAYPGGGAILPPGVPTGPHGSLGSIAQHAIGFATVAVSGLFELPPHRLLLLVVVIGTVGVVIRRRCFTPRIFGLAITLLAYWVTLAAVRGGFSPMTSSRYIYPAVVIILMVWIELAQGVRVPRVGVAVLGVVVAAIAVAGVLELRTFGRHAQRSFDLQRQALMKLERGSHPPSYRPDPVRMPVSAGPYLSAIEDLGSPVTAR